MSERAPYEESSDLPSKSKLLRDTFNDWFGGVSFFCYDPSRTVLHPIRHYEERQRALFAPKAAEEILQASDPDAIQRYNQIVDEFNAEVDRINQEKDVETAKSYLKRIKEVLFEGR